MDLFDVVGPTVDISPPAHAVAGARAVSDAARDQFARDCVICLQQVIDAEAIDVLRAAVDGAIDRPGPHGCRVANPDESGFFLTDCDLWQRERASFPRLR